MARQRDISWQGKAFSPADCISEEDLDRLAELAKVEDPRRADFKFRLGRMAATYVAHGYNLAERPTDAEVEGHLARIRETAAKLLGLLFGVGDRYDPSLRHLDLQGMPDRVRTMLATGMNRQIRSGRIKSPPGYPMVFASREGYGSHTELGGDDRTALSVQGVQHLLAGAEEAIEALREKAARRPDWQTKRSSPMQSQRGFTVEIEIIDHAFELYSMYGLPHVHEGGKGGCGYAPFAIAVLEAIRRKVPSLRALARGTVNTRLAKFRKNGVAEAD